MYCAISGEVPQQPVVSAVSGHVFEQRLIEKALEASNGVCPATGEPLSKSQLILIKADLAVRPKPLTATSLPGMLALFQNEWDDVMLEMHATKQQLHATRKELSHALYQHDAACRVIARLARERDEARGAVAGAQANSARAGAEPAEAMDVESAGLGADVVAHLTDYWKRASKSRKKRPAPPGLATPDAIKAWAKSPKSTEKLFVDGASATCADVAAAGGGVTALLGSASGGLAVASRAAGGDVTAKSVVDVAHAGGVACAAFVSPALFVTAGADGAKLWKLDASCALVGALAGAASAAAVTGVVAHPTGEYVAVARADASWALYAVGGAAPKLLADVSPAAAGEHCPAVAFHPDGLILATPTGNAVRIWDVKEQKNVHSFEGHTAPVNAVAFSENGYYMASASDDATVRVWDLRKLSELKVLQCDGPAKAVCFDDSGKYLAHATPTGIAVDVVKEWTRAAQIATDASVGCRFAPEAKYLVASKQSGCVDLFE
ncbi:WD40-repeat-containing domain protein [Pelagophyceae sp. CCMP2097]|nr:WD40-repeat-containing domain protein [Pelagophyceae sp. CCMP2097]